jgi:hypothetical protein
METHFGLKVQEGKYGLKLTRDNYVVINNRSSFYEGAILKASMYTDKDNRFYKDEWCQEHLLNCLENFDLNMRFFSHLN